MPSKHDQRCTSRQDDWSALWVAVKAFLTIPSTFPLINPKARIGHELKNIVVEEWRRWTGKCPKPDEHEPEI